MSHLECLAFPPAPGCLHFGLPERGLCLRVCAQAILFLPLGYTLLMCSLDCHHSLSGGPLLGFSLRSARLPGPVTVASLLRGRGVAVSGGVGRLLVPCPLGVHSFSFFSLCIWLHWVFVGTRRCSLIVQSGGTVWLQHSDLSLQQRRLQSTGSVVGARALWPSCMGSSPDQGSNPHPARAD